MELSDEDVAKLLAKDIDKHKSKAVPWTTFVSGFHSSVILPSGELTFCHGKSPFLMGKPTINGHFQLLC